MKIRDSVSAVLLHCVAEGHVLKIAGRLPRHQYDLVNKVLVAAGGEWDRKLGGHIFPSDAAEILRQLKETGEVATQQEMGTFFTPAAVVDLVMQRAGIMTWQLVLEPSAGVGNIASKAVRITNVECIEIQPRYTEVLTKSGLYDDVFCGNFLAVEPRAVFDRVVMNPPFAHQQDIDHVQHALKFLAPGGRLVSVMLASLNFRENNKTQEFKDLVFARGGSIEDLPAESFKEAGTSVPTILVTIPGGR